MVNLILETDVFWIQPSRYSLEDSEFMDLFLKGFIIMNIRVSLNNYKNHIRTNWDLNKNRSDMFEVDEGNANAKRNNGVILDYDYNSNSM